jgi:hypothetical protein
MSASDITFTVSRTSTKGGKGVSRSSLWKDGKRQQQIGKLTQGHIPTQPEPTELDYRYPKGSEQWRQLKEKIEQERQERYTPPPGGKASDVTF